VRPTWVEIDLGAIRHNVATIVSVVDPSRVCAVVKADAYGHGDVPSAEAALAGGASWLAVALVSEGARLREAGVEAPILLLSEPPPSAAAEAVRWNLTPTVYHREFLDALTAVAPDGLAVQVKLDTGMHRVGADEETALVLARDLVAAGLRLEGVWTHLAVAEEDADFTGRQLELLGGFLKRLAAAGIEPEMVHAANTAGALGQPASRLDMVRAGIGIYGLRPAPGFAAEIDLRPAMRVVSHVSHLRRLPAGSRPSYGRRRELYAEATVATVPIGYADGFARRLGETGGEVLLRGRRYPLAGTVTMDQIVLDIGDDPVEVGDEVVLLGRQGAQEITADEWAEHLGTINYEITCGFGPRMPRRYVS
jgi:alanine racemase